MKHRKTGRQFGRVRSQRKALMHSLLSSLLIHGRIETTEAKAKETKDAIDKIITKAKRAVDSRMEITRKLSGSISQEAIVALMGHMEKFDARVSGYARVIKLAPRKSDSAHVAVIELVDLTKKTAKKKETVTEKKQVKESAK
ncbi:MAG: 50S ribosomal protein L17 [Parcubacteria group bacterium]|jgi:large subunit ribosomal protein L17